MMCITKKDLEDFRKLEADKTVNIFNIMILNEILCNNDTDQIEDDKLLDVANMVRECYLKDDSPGYQLSMIANVILLNYKDIKEQDLSPQQILAKFL